MKHICFILFFFSLTALAEPELKGSPNELQAFLIPESKTVSLSGSHEITVYSDTAVVNLIVTTEEETLGKSLSKNSLIREKLISDLMNLGINKDKINNSKFSSSPEYGWFGKKPSSYKVINRITVKVSNENLLKEIALISDTKEEIQLSGTTFEDSKKQDHEQTVKRIALERVLHKKEFYQSALNIKLVPVSFRDSDIHVNPTAGASQIEEIVVYGIRSSGSSKSQSNYVAPRSTFDELKYHTTVTVDFKISK